MSYRLAHRTKCDLFAVNVSLRIIQEKKGRTAAKFGAQHVPYLCLVELHRRKNGRTAAKFGRSRLFTLTTQTPMKNTRRCHHPMVRNATTEVSYGNMMHDTGVSTSGE